MRLCRVPLFVLCLGLSLASVAPAQRLQLGDDAEPLSYDVRLTIDPAKSDFSATAGIAIRVRRPIETLYLNANGLEIAEASITLGGQRLAAQVRAEDEQTVGFGIGRTIAPGELRLDVEYTGKLDDQTTSGVFKLVEGGETYVMTQFEPYDARRAFPCFDEPRFKTPWKITLKIPDGQQAFANTPQTADSSADGFRTVEFSESKPLPSYLVAFAVGPYEIVDGGRAGRNKTPIRILTPKGRAAHATYAAEVTGEVLEHLEDYFGMPYPYEKLDSLTMPIAFGFGAMENAGLITYAQTIILADPATDSIQRQRDYYSIATHELAHQWFGNLVTPVWWDDIWLNEAFASWMTSKIVAQAKPEWREDLDRVSSRLGVMRQDNLASARQIRQPIEKYGDINSAFDGITYVKGLAVIHMFERWVGEDDFRNGVRSYLRSYSWRNANVNAFLDSVSTAAKKDVTGSFSTFLDQSGIPLVEFELQCNSAPTLKLRQSRALPVGSEGSRERDWQTPVCVRYESGGEIHRECRLLTKTEETWALEQATACPAWVSPNADGDGYYRVKYGDGMLRPLMRDGGRVLTAAERLSLIGDLQALMEMNGVSAAEALQAAKEFAADPDRAVVQAAMQLPVMADRVIPDAALPGLERFVDAAFGPRARELGWTRRDDEDEETRLLRPSLAALAARRGGAGNLLAEAKKLSVAWLDDRAAVAPEVVDAVLNTAAYHGDIEFFRQLRAELDETQDRQDRRSIFTAMGSFRDPEAVKAALNVLLDESVDLRESFRLLMGLSGLRETRDETRRFVRENFDSLVARLPGRGIRSLGAELPTAESGFCSEEDASGTEEFYTERVSKFAGGARNVRETAEKVRLCAALRAAQEDNLVEYLSGF